jgi:hypothetical protein
LMLIELHLLQQEEGRDQNIQQDWAHTRHVIVGLHSISFVTRGVIRPLALQVCEKPAAL